MGQDRQPGIKVNPALPYEAPETQALTPTSRQVSRPGQHTSVYVVGHLGEKTAVAVTKELLWR